MRRAAILAATAASIPVMAGCGTPSPEHGGDVPAPPAAPAADALRAAPEQLTAGASSLSLEVEAWRSFQPTMDTIPNRLIAVLRVHATGKGGEATGGSVPEGLGMEGVWLLRGAEVVRGDAREEQPREPGGRTVEFVLRDGPLWPPGDSIDVVASVTGVGGTASLLRAPRIAIARVD